MGRPSRAARGSNGPVLRRAGDAWSGCFVALASPCEVLVDTDDRDEAAAATHACVREAARIEARFSRYRTGSLVDGLNRAAGSPVEVDDETAGLLDYAATCHEISQGRFDITSGVLRRLWNFDGGSAVPDAADVRELLRLVGWHRAEWRGRTLTMPAGMEVDLGGLGKEYAVDRAAALVASLTRAPVLVNFGGDLFASGPRRGDRAWVVGVDDPSRTGEAATYRVELERGGLATSGDARRYVLWNGRRLGHILDPRTGWPVEGAPRSVTVLASTCLEAGTLSTLAILHGAGARAFLEAQGVQFRIQ